MSAKYSAKQISKYFIWKAAQEGKKISNKKLQKLLYYAQAWSLALKNKPLFNEDIEAWIHGPTIKSVYDEYKRFGFSPISVNIDEKEIESFKDDDLLSDVWRVYGKYDADYLEALTHKEEPWQVAREGLEQDEASGNIISTELMADYYKKRLQTAKSHG